MLRVYYLLKIITPNNFRVCALTKICYIFGNKKNQIGFFPIFHFKLLLWICYSGCPSLCRPFLLSTNPEIVRCVHILLLWKEWIFDYMYCWERNKKEKNIIYLLKAKTSGSKLAAAIFFSGEFPAFSTFFSSRKWRFLGPLNPRVIDHINEAYGQNI